MKEGADSEKLFCCCCPSKLGFAVQLLVRPSGRARAETNREGVGRAVRRRTTGRFGGPGPPLAY
jgi:hypothetical protein